MSRVLTLSKSAIQALIIEPEVSSESYYNKHLQSPIYPGGDSGITVMFGMDLGYQTPLQIQKELAGICTPNEIGTLQKYSGKRGAMCKEYLPQIQYLRFSWDKALRVFYRASIPRYCRMMVSVYPEVDNLHPYEQTAILSVVYNRGSKITDSPDDKEHRRLEMQQLVQAIKDDDDNKMAALVRSMERLWVNKNLNGLLKRYENIAHYIELLDIPIPDIDKLLIEV